LIGPLKALSLLSRIKDNVVHVGPSPQLVPSKELFKLHQVPLLYQFLNNNWLIALDLKATKVAMVV